MDIEVKGKPIGLAICRARKYEPTSCCQRAHAFLICFSVDDPSSLDDIVSKWDPEIKQLGGGAVPRFLVGCKKDLREDEDTIRRLNGIGQARLVSNEERRPHARLERLISSARQKRERA